jgi:hypothetical protein
MPHGQCNPELCRAAYAAGAVRIVMIVSLNFAARS